MPVQNRENFADDLYAAAERNEPHGAVTTGNSMKLL